MRYMSTMRNVVVLIGMALVVGAMPTAAAALSKRPAAAANADVRHLVRMMDTDKNGSVSKDEFMQFMSQKFDRLDLNKSGQLESNELSNAASPFGKRTNAAANADVRQLVKMMDSDKSGTVSKDEFLQFVSQTFDRLDANKNGELEREELRQMDDPDWLLCHDMHIC
jgi:Ca2+-binding EF-hand superfamily protein